MSKWEKYGLLGHPIPIIVGNYYGENICSMNIIVIIDFGADHLLFTIFGVQLVYRTGILSHLFVYLKSQDCCIFIS